MKIDLDKLTEHELVELNNQIVARLNFIQQHRSHSQMLKFNIGDRVFFQPSGHPMLTGMLTRYNKKTVTVITDFGQQWNVAPGLLCRDDKSTSTSAETQTSMHLVKK